MYSIFLFLCFLSVFLTLFFNIMDFKHFDIFADGGKNNLGMACPFCLEYLGVVPYLICSVMSTGIPLNFNQKFDISFLFPNLMPSEGGVG